MSIRHPILLCLAVLSAGCEALEKGGNSANGYFTVQPAGAVAAGTTVDLSVSDYELGTAPEVQVALSAPMLTPATVAAVAGAKGDAVTVKALSPGTATLAFSAEADGQTRADSYRFDVVQPVAFKLQHLCPNAIYLAERPAEVEFFFEDLGQRKALGRGLYPVELAPVGGATLDTAASGHDRLVVALSSQAITLTSQLTRAGEQPSMLSISVVPSAEVDGLALVDASSFAPLVLGSGLNLTAREVRVVATRAGTQICGTPVPVRVSVVAGSACELLATKLGNALTSLDVTGSFFLRRRDYGACRLVFDLLDVAFDAVANLEFTFQTTRPSGGGGGGGFD